MKEEKIYYVYYSYKQFGRGYIGYRKCPEGLTPETDNYLGSFRDKGFKPTEKIILFQNLTKLEAMEIEIYLHNFYNIDKNDHFANKAKQTSLGFCCGNTGKNHSVETKKKLSELKLGEKNPQYGKKCYNNGINHRYFSPDEEIPKGYFLGFNEETKNKCSEAKKGEKNPMFGCTGEKHPMFGQTHSEETRKKQSEANKGKPKSEEHKQKLSEANIGKKHSEERRKKQSEAQKGKNIGKKHSGETKKKQSEAKKSINSKKKIRVITSLCCYFSIKDARKELGISNKKFYKLFEKDPITGFYVEKQK